MNVDELTMLSRLKGWWRCEFFESWWLVKAVSWLNLQRAQQLYRAGPVGSKIAHNPEPGRGSLDMVCV